MSKVIEAMFQQSLMQALREENHNAEKWKKETEHIRIDHLLCCCGKPIKDKLINGLLTSSSRSFENFMFGLFNDQPSKGHEEIEIVKQKAIWQKEHPSLILFDHLIKKQSILTLGDIIDCLEEAHLYRIISSFDSLSVNALKEHAFKHKNKGCCVVDQNYGFGFSPGVSSPFAGTNGLPLSAKGRRVSKSCRGIILLTFQEDGRNHAMEVKETLENPSEEGRLSYTVYTLYDFKKYIIADFSKNILWILSKVDFVVPILTDDYFKMLRNETAVSSNGFDETYAPYVAKVLEANWASSFKNKRLRSYKPSGVKWPSEFISPPFLTAVTEASALPSILIKSKN